MKEEENFHGGHGEHGDKKSSVPSPVFPVSPVEIFSSSLPTSVFSVISV